jgi:hypothetical protein
MKNNGVTLGVIFLVAALSFGAQFTQSVPARTQDSPPQDRLLVVGLLRTINTAEVADFVQYGSYSTWQALLAHEQEYLNSWITTYYSPNPNARFSDGLEVLPGLRLRLNVHTDGKGYDVMLEDLNDKAGYAVVTDERGIGRECRFLR